MDDPNNTAFNQNAPDNERADALSGLQKSFIPGQSDLIPGDVLQELISYYQHEPLQKAINPNDVPFPSPASKEGKEGMQSVWLNDFQVSSNGDYWERPSTLSFDALRSMAVQTPILNAVVMTRTRQLQRFCRVSETDTGLPGFEIRHIDRKHTLTASEAEKAATLNRFMANCGLEFSGRARKQLRRDSFAQFMGKVTRDSLILDSVGIETEWSNDRRHGLNGLYAVDGATIRLCSENGYRNNPDFYALQVVNGLVRTAYTFDDLIYESRNPRSDVTAAGYGLPETELLIRVVTGFLNAMTLNNNVFDKNSFPKGILHLSGNYSTEDMAAFKRYWNSMVKGLDNAFAMPVLVSKDQDSKASFEKLGVDFSEMMFAKWMTFLTSLICAIYGMSPAEINFDSFTGGTTSALGGSDTAEKLAASKDSGLRPLLSYFENLLTDYVVSEFNEDFCFRWTGLDVEDQDKKHELRLTILTVNELRSEEGYEKLEGPLGDAPVNPSLVGPWMQLQSPPEDDGDGQESENNNGTEQADDELAKAFKHHAGRPGQKGGSAPKEAGAELPSSEVINTLPEAKQYYRDHVAGIWQVTIKRKAGNFSAKINLNDNKDHAYTKTNAITGNREFDAKRARLMQHLLSAVTAPDVILQNGSRDLFVEKHIEDLHYAVVLEWKEGANEYRFRSAHYWDKAEYNKNVSRYQRPVTRGKKTDKNTPPKRLIKSLGEATTFPRLRDSIANMQSPLEHNCKSSASLVNSLEPGDAPDNSGIGWRFSCLNSIDASANFVKSGDWEVVYGEVELLHKALSDDDIFKPHPNIFIKPLVEDYSDQGMIRLSAVRIALNEWLDGKYYHPGPQSVDPGSLLHSPYWTDDDAAVIETYLKSIKPEAFSVDDAALLAKLLVRQNLPTGAMIDDALTNTAQSLMMGAAQARWQAQHPELPITETQVQALMDALPNTLEGVVRALSMGDAARAMLDYGSIRAAENIVALTDDARRSLQSVLMDHQLKRASGDESATAAKLQQTLGDKFADMNRDWRRIAITETGEMANQGFILSQQVGAKVKRIERNDACPFCRKIDGRVMTVADPANPNKDGKTEVWYGKTNIGRSSSPNKRTEQGLEPRQDHELWWPAAGLQHPHCRGSWLPFVDIKL